MLHHIKELFQKSSWLKTKETGAKKLLQKTIFRRLSIMEMPGVGTQEQIQQNQHGRTMTEMLGVLAIIGVLSIGALAGYQYAMDKQRANVTINDINLRGVDLIIQASRSIPLNLEEWGNTSTAGYTFGTPEHVADGFVKLSVSGLPKRVCEMVVDGLSTQYDMDINGAQIDAGASCGDDNVITVYFDAAGSTGTDDCGGCPGLQECVGGVCTCTNGGTGENCETSLCGGVRCGECQKCQDGACVDKADYETCSNGYCERGLCISNEDSVTGSPCSNDYDCRNSCMYCGEGVCQFKEDGASCGENGVCRIDMYLRYGECILPCSENNPLRDEGGYCYSCDTPSPIYLGYGEEGNCSVCPNRMVTGDNYCALAECPADKPLRDIEGACYSCDAPYSVYVSGVEGNCAACPGRVMRGDYCALPCPADKPLMDNYVTCYSCDTTSSVPVWGVEGNCAVCENRVVNGNYCVLPCPSDKPLMDSNGTCYSCDEGKRVFVYRVESNCAVCENRVIKNNYCVLPECPADKPLKDSNGNCHSCNEESIVSVWRVTGNCSVCSNRKLEGSDCILSKCPADKPLRSKNGSCYACDEVSSVYVSGVTGNCDVCDNRVLQGYNNNYCALPCPSDKPLMDNYGTCHSCTTTSSVNVRGVTENCSVCSNRVLVNNNYCVLPCPPDKPLMNKYGNCYFCNTTRGVYVEGVTENCAVCPNRVLNGSDCVLPCPSDRLLMSSDGTCHSCDTTSRVYVRDVEENCAVCPNRKLDGDSCILSE